MPQGINILFRITFSIVIVICSSSAFCQSSPGINSIIKQFNNTHDQLPIEKLYLQSDKSDYFQNDTIWFKSYLLNADYLTASTRSGLLYVELDDINNKMVKRMMYPINMGLGWGNIALGNDIIEGSYTIRAYTNWMRNFGEDYVFKKYIYVTSVQNQPRLITANFKEVKVADKTNIRAMLLFSNLNKEPLILQDMRFNITDGRRTLLRANATTDIAGKMDINFDLPANASMKDITIITRDIVKNRVDTASTYIIPVIVDSPQNTDLQFMPEGGDLVARISSLVGFKAIGEDGKGINVSGKILDNKQQVVTEFKSTHYGMGAFELTPLSGQTYTAILTLSGGEIKRYAMPSVKSSGTVLRIINKPADSLRVVVSVTPDINIAPVSNNYYLIGQSRDVICYVAHIVMKKGTTVSSVPKNAFPTGIVHFMLLNNAGIPLNERIVYVEHNDNLQIRIEPNRRNYAPHDSIALNIKVTDKSGKPIRGSFSMAVTDDSQVKIDSIGSNIINDLLLTSDLKGTVEEPGYYFDDDDLQRKIDLDNLLLTQGWISYNRKQSLAPAYPAEKEFTIQGTVTNAFNKPVAGSRVILLSKKPMFVVDTITNNEGRFTFKGFLPVDTASFMIQARNKHGNSFNVGVDVDEFKLPVFTQIDERVIPWYVNSDTLSLNNLNNRIAKQQKEEKLQGFGHILKEVTIKDKKIIKDSKNLNGPGGADQIFDEHDMLKAGKMSLGDLLTQKIKGFNEARFRINDELVYFVFDGILINTVYSPSGEINGLYNFIKQYLDNYTAEDITGIEVIFSRRYNANYIVNFLSPKFIGDPIAFVEITTRSGQGPYMRRTPGTYLHKPLAATLPKQFYRPKYNMKSVITGTDLRSTIHWEPNIITDTAGKATVSFYTADKPATYTITIEGSDLNGSLGSKQKKIQVH